MERKLFNSNDLSIYVGRTPETPETSPPEEEPIRIQNIDDLKAWNDSPTDQAPIVQEWFLPWFFKLLEEKRFDEAIEARAVMIRFTELCEKMSPEEATSRVDSNFNYYSGYSVTRWTPAWRKLKKKIGVDEER